MLVRGRLTLIRSKNYILDFTHVYIDEDIQQESGISLIDCSDIEGCDLYCSKAAEIEIKKRTEQYGIHGIHFIDSGNFHYITKINIDRIMKPFSLVLYDHHTDMQEPMINKMTSCGDWAAQIINENKNLVQLILIGATENDIEQIHIKNREKLITFSAEELRSGIGKDKLSKIMTDVPFYISIVKIFWIKIILKQIGVRATCHLICLSIFYSFLLKTKRLLELIYVENARAGCLFLNT
mgnify:CR=1 FL=1